MSDPFRTRDHVADFDDIVRDMVLRSAATRTRLQMASDVAYGTDPSETLDIFFPRICTPNMPVHIFIHGGYWRMFSKKDYSYVADTVTDSGVVAVIVDYAFMPSVRMAKIVEQVRQAKRWIIDHITEYGGDPMRLSVSGHSAGAHLATFLFDKTQIPSGIGAALLLGGLYELKPLQSSFLRNEIAITDQEVADFTPLAHRYDQATKVRILVGEHETPPFHQQAKTFGDVLEHQGLLVSRTILDQRNHMSSVRDLGEPDSQAGQSLVELLLSAEER